MNRPIILDVHGFSFLGPHFPEPDACPHCGSKNFVPISYGLPTKETAARARAGEFVLGGCMVGSPRWHCKVCRHSWPKDGSWNFPTEEEWLAYRLRLQRHQRRPDVFLLHLGRRLRWMAQSLVEEHIRTPLLIHRERPTIAKKNALKDGGYCYTVQFRSEVVKVQPEYGDRRLLVARCRSKRNFLAGTPESRRYEAAAMRLVFEAEPQCRAQMEAAQQEARRALKRPTHRNP